MDIISQGYHVLLAHPHVSIVLLHPHAPPASRVTTSLGLTASTVCLTVSIAPTALLASPVPLATP